MKHLWIHIGVLGVIVGLIAFAFVQNAEASTLSPEREAFMCSVGTAPCPPVKFEPKELEKPLEVKKASTTIERDLAKPEDEKIATLRELIKQLRALLDELKARQ